MAFDDRKLPSIIVCIIAVILLALAFYNNFIPSEEIIVDEIVNDSNNDCIVGRNSNIIYDDVDIVGLQNKYRPYLDGIETKNYNNKEFKSGTPIKIRKDSLIGTIVEESTESSEDLEELEVTEITKQDSPGTLIVISRVELSNNLNNEILIQMINDTIYTVTLPSVERKGFILNLWNNSNFAKNIKTSASFVLGGMEKGKFITMKPQKVLILQSTGKSWLIINDSDITDNRDLIEKYILGQVENLFQSNKKAIDSILVEMEKKFIGDFLEDKNTYNLLIANKFREIEHSINLKISTIDLVSLEKRIYDKLQNGPKIKIENGINPHEDSHMIDIIHDELKLIKEEIENLGSSLKKQILESMYTENSEFRSKILFLVDDNKKIILEEIKSKIGSSIESQIANILSKLDGKINIVFDERIRDYIVEIKEYFNSAIQIKLEEYSTIISDKLDIFKYRMTQIETTLKATIETEVLSLQEKFQSQIVSMKENLILTIENRIDILQKRFNTIRNDLSNKIDSFKCQIDCDISSYKQTLKKDLSTQISTIRNELVAQLTNISNEITDNIETQQEYIDSEIELQKAYIEKQLEAVWGQLQSQKTYIQSQLQVVKSTASSDSVAIQNQLTILQSNIETISAEINQLLINIQSGTVDFSTIDATTIVLTGLLNNLNIQIASNSGVMLYGDSSSNTFLGVNYGMNTSTDYTGNVGIGANTFSFGNMSYGYNTFIGCNGFRNSSGDYNTGMGFSVSQFEGSNNSFYGYQAGFATSGNNNVVMGFLSGQYMTGNYNTLLGSNILFGNNDSNNSNSYSYSTGIGASAIISQNNQMVLGGNNNGIFPNVFIPGTLSIGVENPSSDIQLEVNGNVQFDSNTICKGPLYATGGFQIPIIGGYIVSINASGQYFYNPIVFSTSSIEPNDSYIILNPGYKIEAYIGVNYSNIFYTVDNTNGTSVISVSSNTLYGGNNSIMSYSLYFNGNLVVSV